MSREAERPADKKAARQERLEAQVAGLPASPGVYLFKGAKGEVLYVGKAKDLRSRVRSYFRASHDARYQIPFLLAKVADIDVLLTDTEKEAVLLEDALIKEHKPLYNVDFKDDKTLVSLRLDTAHPWPLLEVVRLPHGPPDDGARYFGPYSSAAATRATIRELFKIFPVRSCSDTVFRGRTRPCLYYDIKQCVAPCVEGYTTRQEYDELVRQVVLQLEGRSGELVRQLTADMKRASRELRFEEAGDLLQRIQAIERTVERQKVARQASSRNQDTLGLYREGDRVTVQRLTVRRGKLVGGEARHLERMHLPDDTVLADFLARFYLSEEVLPEEVLLPMEVPETGALEGVLSERRGRRVRIRVPRRGEARQLVLLARRNAEQAFRRRGDESRALEEVQAELASRLKLARSPETVECVDVAAISGKLAAGSIVRFAEGRPAKSGYRKYRIRGAKVPDDYAMMREVLSRRFRRGLEEGDLPDLLVVDGGKGQLNIALAVLQELGVEGLSVVALAKERHGPSRPERKAAERVYLPGRKNPVLFPRNSGALFLLQRIRDEAHRFAQAYHAALGKKQTLRSVLDEVPGIGTKRKQQLMKAFGSLKSLREAAPEEIVRRASIPDSVARTLSEWLKAEA
jgi:excinuclease ABC subunit C